MKRKLLVIFAALVIALALMAMQPNDEGGSPSTNRGTISQPAQPVTAPAQASEPETEIQPTATIDPCLIPMPVIPTGYPAPVDTGYPAP